MRNAHCIKRHSKNVPMIKLEENMVNGERVLLRDTTNPSAWLQGYPVNLEQ